MLLLDHKVSLVEMLPSMKFTYNNNYQAMIQMATYKALYGQRCRSLLHYDKLSEKDVLIQSLGLKLTQKMIDDV